MPSKEAVTLQIGSVAFLPGQYTSPQLHPCHRLFTKTGIKTVRHPSYSPDFTPCDFCLFPKLRSCRYETNEEMKEAVTKFIDTLTPWGFPEVVGTVQQVDCSRGRLLRKYLRFMCVLSTKVPKRKMSGNLSYAPCIYILCVSV